MKEAVTVQPRRIDILQGAEPEPKAGEALLSVEVVGLCGSDLHLFTGEHPYARFPQRQGHELSGRVLWLPPDYAGALELGHRVAVEPLSWCGSCLPCRRGRQNCCMRLRVLGAHAPGGLAERIAIRVDSLFAAHGLDAELAALVEPMSIGVQAVARAGVRERDQVVIFGAGPIGQAILLAAGDQGGDILVVDRLAARLDLARELGAALTVDAAVEDPEKRIAEWTRGEGPVVVFEATGVPSVLRTAVDVVGHSGTVVVVGLSREEVAIPMVDFTRKEISVIGSRNNAGLFGDAVALVERHQAHVRQLISHRFPLDQTQAALEFALGNQATTQKVVINVGERP